MIKMGKFIRHKLVRGEDGTERELHVGICHIDYLEICDCYTNGRS